MVFSDEIEIVEANQLLLEEIAELALEAADLKGRGLTLRSDIDAYRLKLYDIKARASQLGQVL